MKRFLFLTLFLIGFSLIFVSSYLYAQDDAFEPDEYVGVNECSACHRGQARDHAASPHVLTLQETSSFADFDQGEETRMVTLPGADEATAFTAEDVALVVGAGRYMQVFLYAEGENQYRVLPALWNTTDSTWQAYGFSENWLEDARYDWDQSCAGCHTTGYNVETAAWSDPAVQCEACHGPGGAHVNLANELPRRADEADVQEVRNAIVNRPDGQICGQCHSQGIASDGVHPFPVGYHPGEALGDFFTVMTADDADFWWDGEHARHKYMQYNEWLLFGHAGALEDLQGVEGADPACMTCHSEDYRYNQRITEAHEAGDWEGVPPEPLTVETAQFGVTCTTCHNPHLVGEEAVSDFFLRDELYNLCVACHNDNEITEGIHFPAQEMFEGQSVTAELEEAVEPIPSAHFTAENGPRCATCHMQRVAVEDSPGGRTTHAQQVVMPGTAADLEGLESACADCHAEQADPDSMQLLIDATQTGVETRLTAAREAITGDSPVWVAQALDFVESDASMGVHNFTYTSRLLSAAEHELGLVAADTGGVELPEILTDAADERDNELEVTDAVSEEGVAPIAIAIMALAVLAILIAAYFFFGRGQAHA